MTAPPEHRTERLLLRKWHEDDAPDMRRALDECDAHLRPWIPFMQGEPRSMAETRDKLREARESFEQNEHFRYAIRLPDDDTFLGETMLLRRGGDRTLEAGYWLHQDHCGKGYASEATAAMLPIAFAFADVDRVIMRCDVRNASSLRVAERLGGVRIDTEELEENGVTVQLAVLAIERP